MGYKFDYRVSPYSFIKTLTEQPARKIKSADFDGANIAELSFSKMHLEHVRFSCCLGRQADFTAATLVDVSFKDGSFPFADFRKARFSRCSLRDANLTCAQFEGAVMIRCDLRGAHFLDHIVMCFPSTATEVGAPLPHSAAYLASLGITLV